MAYCSSVMAVSDVAIVRAVFSVVVSVGREDFSAVGAGKGIKGLAVDLVQMAVPPFGAAGIGEELHRFSARNLGQLLSAVAATVRVRTIFCMHGSLGAGELVSAAEGGYLIFGQAQRSSDGGISIVLFTQSNYLAFL